MADTGVVEGVATAELCDRCGAAAAVQAILPSGMVLTFCQHHADKFGPVLQEQAAVLPLTARRIGI